MRSLTLCAICVSLIVVGTVSEQMHGQDKTAPKPVNAQNGVEQQRQSQARDPDWDALRKSAEAYVVAFNAGDASAIAELYTEDAELVDSSGNKFRGRAVIAEEYGAFFKEHPDATLQMVVEKITFASPSVAIEDGKTESTLTKGGAPSLSRYVAVHVKEGNRWRLASVRDEAVSASAEDKLDELTWLIGEWVDEAPGSRMEIDCYWHESGSYLMRDFRIKIEGLLASNGTERIGWDPLRKQVRSWLFDADGGYLEASWIKKGEQWHVTAQGFRSDGRPTHATYVVSSLREDAYHMDATNRTSGGEALDDFEMTIVRRPPPPGKVPSLKGSAESGSPPDGKQE